MSSIEIFNLSVYFKIGLFKPEDFNDPAFSDELEGDIASECEKCGTIEKITLFSSNPRGIAVVKFSTSYAAQECIRLMNGRFFGGSQLKSFFWWFPLSDLKRIYMGLGLTPQRGCRARASKPTGRREATVFGFLTASYFYCFG